MKNLDLNNEPCATRVHTNQHVSIHYLMKPFKCFALGYCFVLFSKLTVSIDLGVDNVICIPSLDNVCNPWKCICPICQCQSIDVEAPSNKYNES
jgi:hypothetical protein